VLWVQLSRTLEKRLPKSSEGQKKEENVQVATMGLQEEKEGQEYAEKEKRSDTPDPPPFNHAAFIRHVQTLPMKE